MKPTISKIQRQLSKCTHHSSLRCWLWTSTSPFPWRSRSRSSHYKGEFSELKPPGTKRIPVPVSAHGITWHDPYQWMSDAQDPAVIRHLQEENRYTEAYMADTLQLQRQLEAEMFSRMAPELSTPPERWGPWLYYQRIPEGKEYPVLCRRLGKQDGFLASLVNYVRGLHKEEILLDWNEIAEQFGYVNVGTYRISPDHRYLAYTLDASRKEVFTLHVKDLRTGSVLSNTNIEGVVGLAWAKDGQILLYTVSDALQRPFKVLVKELHSECEDMVLFEEKNKSCCVDITNTKDCQFITINSNSRTSSEVYLIDSSNIMTGLQRIRKREAGVQYFVEHHHGLFYMLTNAPLGDNKMVTENYYLARCSIGNLGSKEWQNVLQAHEDITIEDMDIFDKYLVLLLQKQGSPVICSLDMPLQADVKDRKQIEDFNSWFLPMPANTCVVIPGSNHDFKSSVFRAMISSPLMPEVIVDYDLSSQQLTLVQQEEVKGVIGGGGKSRSSMNQSEFSQSIQVLQILSMETCNRKKAKRDHAWSDFSELYCCERREVASHDAVKIPLTIIYSRKVKLNGTSAGVIHGYGAYGEVLDKRWCSDHMSLLDRGWIIAYADVRGGGGRGKCWHNTGKGLQKLNSIYDFLSCSKYLVKEGYVNKNLLGAMGISAGGLLIAAAVNMCPDLYQAVILKVPFLDICNTLLDPGLPLTVLDYEEFGDPRNFADFATIQSYSPYDNIQKGVCYPATLVIASFHDSRVGYWEAAKWVARVREHTVPDCSRSILLKTNMDTGHFGEGGRYGHCKETAFVYAFLLKIIGA